MRRLLTLAAADDVCFANTMRSVLEATNAVQVALTVVVPEHVLVAVAHVPVVGEVGIDLRSRPPVAEVADIEKITIREA